MKIECIRFDRIKYWEHTSRYVYAQNDVQSVPEISILVSTHYDLNPNLTVSVSLPKLRWHL